MNSPRKAADIPEKQRRKTTASMIERFYEKITQPWHTTLRACDIAGPIAEQNTAIHRSSFTSKALLLGINENTHTTYLPQA